MSATELTALFPTDLNILHHYHYHINEKDLKINQDKFYFARGIFINNCSLAYMYKNKLFKRNSFRSNSI